MLRPAIAQDSEVIESKPIALTGKELGDFDTSTAEGKKALRVAAQSELEALKGKWLPCPALGGDVEIRKQGIKKVISSSSDPLKLKLIPALVKVLANAKEFKQSTESYLATEKNVKAYHYLRSELSINGSEYAARVVIKEDDAGAFHYDHTIHNVDAVLDSANKNALTKVNALTTCQPECHTEQHQVGDGKTLISRADSVAPPPTPDYNSGTSEACLIKPQSNTGVNAIFDAATGKMVLNLFLQIKDPWLYCLLNWCWR